jgi:uncharacterized protein with NRDE domain
MCLIVLAYRVHPDYPVVIAANRDEFYARPTRPLAPWKDGSNIVAGRDLEGGGTWMGIHGDGRLAAVTNYRDPAALQANAPSRGHLVSDYLRGGKTLTSYLKKLLLNGHRYNGFNLLFSNGEGWRYYSNRGTEPLELSPGIHGLSNHLLNTPWPKVSRSCRAVEKLLASNRRPDMDALMGVLEDRHVPPDDNLPRTGIGLEWERLLGSVFIHSDSYGTRSSTVVLVSRAGGAVLRERTFDQDGLTGEVEHRLRFCRGGIGRSSD